MGFCNLVFGCFSLFLVAKLQKYYIIVYLLFFTEQGKTGKNGTHGSENLATYFWYFGSFDKKQTYENNT